MRYNRIFCISPSNFISFDLYYHVFISQVFDMCLKIVGIHIDFVQFGSDICLLCQKVSDTFQQVSECSSVGSGHISQTKVYVLLSLLGIVRL